MKKLIFVSFVIVIMMFSCGNGNQNKTSSASDGYRQTLGMTGERTDAHLRDTVNLGRIKRGEIIEYRLGLRNDDDTPLLILGIINGCGCTTLDYDKNPAQPGEILGITLRYDSKGQRGTQLKVFQVTTSLSEQLHNIMLLAEVEE